MAIARILVSVTLRVEVYDEADGSDARITIERELLANARRFVGTVIDDLEAKPLDDTGATFEEQRNDVARRPHFVLRDVAPKTWKATFNSFRKADELDIEIPLAMLPVPPDAVRVISCSAVIRHVTPDEWAAAVESGQSAIPALAPNDANADFAGVATSIRVAGSTDNVPTAKLHFLDYLGLLANTKVKPGHELGHNGPISEMVRAFLVGMPGEGLAVKWVDPNFPEPRLGDVMPKAKQKKKGKTAAKTAYGKESYLDVITEACGLVGVVPHLRVTTIELAYSGAVYEGQIRGTEPKSTILLGRHVEDFDAEHDLVGMKTQSVGVTSYNPDTDERYMARWPPEPTKVAPTKVPAGKPPVPTPVAANIGLPGYEQLDESLVMVQLPPCRDPQYLLQAAQAIFLERTRQRMRWSLKMHAPWSDPSTATLVGGDDILRLRAGDTVSFGVVPSSDDAFDRLPASVRVLSGEIGEAGIAQLIRSAGGEKRLAERAAAAIAKAPRYARWRVDEMSVGGGDSQDPEIALKLVNFTVITSDLEAKAKGASPDQVLAFTKTTLELLGGGMSDAALNAFFNRQRNEIDAGDGSDEVKADAKKALDAQQKAFKARRKP